MIEQKSERICKYFLQGRCRFQNSCKFSHIVVDCYLVRHALSQFNQKLQKSTFDASSNEAKDQYHLAKELIDCGVTQEGLNQIKNMNIIEIKDKKSNQIKVDCIFVSPLQRALMTTLQMIKIHNIQCNKVIVLANLTQVLSKICDFMRPVEQAIKKYPSFDFSIFKEEIKNNEQKWQDGLVSESFKKYINQNQKSGQRYIQALDKLFPEPLQTSYNCYGRSMRVISQIKKICLAEGYRKILIVSHNRIIKYIWGRQEGGRVNGLLNCEIRQTYI